MLVSKLKLNYSFRPMTFNPNNPQMTSFERPSNQSSLDISCPWRTKIFSDDLWTTLVDFDSQMYFRFFSILKLTGLVFWTISFKSLQEKHENRIKNNLNQRKKVENFNLERNLNQLTASMQSIMKPLIRLVLIRLQLTFDDLDLE